jgi:hypothetical protein
MNGDTVYLAAMFFGVAVGASALYMNWKGHPRGETIPLGVIGGAFFLIGLGKFLM